MQKRTDHQLNLKLQMEYCYNFLESMQAERVETAVPWVHHLSLALFHLFGEERDLLIHTYS